MKIPLTIAQAFAVAATISLAGYSHGAPPPDFNGDGFDDLAVGVPDEDIGSVINAGAVNVIYGSTLGLNAAGDEFWTQNSLGIQDSSEAGDRFGASLGWGDFDNDGFSDLAVGVPGEDITNVADAGAVHVFYGSTGGLAASGNKLWHQNSSGIVDAIQAGDDFGYALTVGDFDGDGFHDLAISVRGEDHSSVNNPGAVAVVYGSTSGLSAGGNQMWHQDSASIGGTAAAGDNFGFALAAADFDNDGRDDLAIGSQDDDIAGIVDTGSVNVIYGSANGLSASGNQFWHQNITGIFDNAEAGDNFGFALTAGDFNGDGRNDLAIGVPEEDVAGIVDAGAVNVLYGSFNGLKTSGNQYWHQDSSNILDDAETGDMFGHSLAAGDFDGDGFDDLAIAVRSEDLGAAVHAGAINVIYGTAARLSSAGNQFWHQDSPGVLGDAGSSENYGDGLIVGNFNAGSRDALAASVHDEDVGSAIDAGAVSILYGSSAGLKSAGNQLWTQNSSNINDIAETGDKFGDGM